MLNSLMCYIRSFRDYIKKTKTKKKALAYFKKIRYEYSDELPLQLVTAQDGNYKCRGNTICGVRNWIYTLLKLDIIKTDQDIENFYEQVSSRDFSRRSTQEDIDQLNYILDAMIDKLSN